MSQEKQSPETTKEKKPLPDEKTIPPKETGGRKGPEPTRYGDWENNGKCVDF